MSLRYVFPEFSRMMQAFERDLQPLQRHLMQLDPSRSLFPSSALSIQGRRGGDDSPKGILGIEGSNWPAVDFREQEGKYVLEAELPGVHKQDVSIDLDESGEVLTLSGHISREHTVDQRPNAEKATASSSSSSSAAAAAAAVEEGDAKEDKAGSEDGGSTALATQSQDKTVGSATSTSHYWAQERFYGQFYRSFRLPGPVTPDQVNATFQDGLLRVTMPKHAPEEKQPKSHHINIGGGDDDKSA